MSKKIEKGTISKEDREAGRFALDLDENYMLPMQEIHCPHCGRFLGFQAIVWGAVKLKCPNNKCRGTNGGRTWVTLDISPSK